MSNFIRTVVFEKVIKRLENVSSVNQHRIMSNLILKYDNITGIYSFSFPLKCKFYDVTNEVKNISKINLEDTFDDVVINDSRIDMNVTRDKYVKKVLENNVFGIMPPLLVENNKNIVVEFSSPNIAKPFHLGHLRSTVVGNYIANISNYLQNKVTRINYLGDWGTQIGYVQLGIEMANIHDFQLENNPLKKLYEVYVMANQAAVQCPELHEKAKYLFNKLEKGDPMISKSWHKIKHCTVLELEKMYKRLGVVFDKYDWESMYSIENISKIMKLMEDMQLLTLDSYNRKVIPISEDREISITKSDGTSLYISRDIAAAIDRFERNKFDVMYYVVDYSQYDHFFALINILKKMKLPWADRLEHIKFGRVHGMSTRAGTAVFLEDILDEAREQMRLRQVNAKTTKVTESELNESSDILGVSSVIIQNLKLNRMNSYEFNWDSILDAKGDSAIKLHYTHCRLCNIELLATHALPTECDPSALRESDIDYLVLLISQFDYTILKSYNTAESCVLTAYLFHLCKCINVAIWKLRIKGEPNDLASQRLLLFHVARRTLAEGMKLLGLTPLERM